MMQMIRKLVLDSSAYLVVVVVILLTQVFTALKS